jgi:hypothetical protein
MSKIADLIEECYANGAPVTVRKRDGSETSGTITKLYRDGSGLVAFTVDDESTVIVAEVRSVDPET